MMVKYELNFSLYKPWLYYTLRPFHNIGPTFNIKKEKAPRFIFAKFMQTALQVQMSLVLTHQATFQSNLRLIIWSTMT